jgi:hypothetical protein
MRRHLLAILTLAAALGAAPMAAYAQMGGRPGGGGGDEEPSSSKKKDEWEDKQAPLPSLRNAGPCPFVKVLYDAGRYIEFADNREAAANVGFTGEIQGISAGCKYVGAEPIHLEMEVLFALGKGPRAQGDSHTYQYWIAVTDRNRTILAKEYFSLPANFKGGDRVMMTDRISSISIPRAAETVSGANFEVLIGFEVTPEMAAFNREGKRFRVNAGAAAAATGSSSSQ